MTKYIDKSALVAEIKNHIKEEPHSYFCKCLLSEINTLEVKDLQEEPYVMSDKGKFTTTTK